DLDPRVRIVPKGTVPLVYDALRAVLEVRRYSTRLFPVDWRKDLDGSARQLAELLRESTRSRQPVHIIAHSQGALVARRALQRLKEYGEEQALARIKNVILLGPTNYGTLAVAFLFAGGENVLTKGWKLEMTAPDPGIQPAFASMSGLYQLLPWD